MRPKLTIEKVETYKVGNRHYKTLVGAVECAADIIAERLIRDPIEELVPSNLTRVRKIHALDKNARDGTPWLDYFDGLHDRAHRRLCRLFGI
jgi:hypothetical protein